MMKQTLCRLLMLATLGLSCNALADFHVRNTLDVWGDFQWTDGLTNEFHGFDGIYDPKIVVRRGGTFAGSYWIAIDNLDGGLQSYGVELNFDPNVIEGVSVESHPQWFLPETTGWDNAEGNIWAFDGRIGGLQGNVQMFDVIFHANRQGLTVISVNDIFPDNPSFDGFVLRDGRVLDFDPINYLPTEVFVTPEPEVWGMMLIGVGMISYALRRCNNRGEN